jgi:hypothetical protein
MCFGSTTNSKWLVGYSLKTVVQKALENSLHFQGSKPTVLYFSEGSYNVCVFFAQECPSGLVNEETFKEIYAQFFPQGGEIYFDIVAFRSLATLDLSPLSLDDRPPLVPMAQSDWCSLRLRDALGSRPVVELHEIAPSALLMELTGQRWYVVGSFQAEKAYHYVTGFYCCLWWSFYIPGSKRNFVCLWRREWAYTGSCCHKSNAFNVPEIRMKSLKTIE